MKVTPLDSLLLAAIIHHSAVNVIAVVFPMNYDNQPIQILHASLTFVIVKIHEDCCKVTKKPALMKKRSKHQIGSGNGYCLLWFEADNTLDLIEISIPTIDARYLFS